MASSCNRPSANKILADGPFVKMILNSVKIITWSDSASGFRYFKGKIVSISTNFRYVMIYNIILYIGGLHAPI